MSDRGPCCCRTVLLLQVVLAHGDGFGGRYELQFVLYDVFIILRTFFVVGFISFFFLLERERFFYISIFTLRGSRKVVRL